MPQRVEELVKDTGAAISKVVNGDPGSDGYVEAARTMVERFGRMVDAIRDAAHSPEQKATWEQCVELRANLREALGRMITAHGKIGEEDGRAEYDQAAERFRMLVKGAV